MYKQYTVLNDSIKIFIRFCCNKEIFNDNDLYKKCNIGIPEINNYFVKDYFTSIFLILNKNYLFSYLSELYKILSIYESISFIKIENIFH